MSTKYVSGRVKELKVGITSYSESKESLSVIGIVSATKYFGDGSNLTGTQTPGIDTTGSSTFNQLYVTGVSTFYNADVVFQGAAAGQNMTWDASENDLEFTDAARIKFGNNDDLEIWHDAPNSHIKNSTGDFHIRSDSLALKTADNSERYLKATKNEDVKLYYNGNEKFATLGTGATVTGDLYATNFYGSGANLTGIDATALKDANGNVKAQANPSGVVFTGIITGNGSGLTNLEIPGISTTGSSNFTNLNVTGVSTFNGDVQFKGALYNSLWDRATSKFKLYDLAQIAFGDGNDLQIYSDGTYGIIKGNDKTKITGITELNVSGISTFQGDLDIESSVLITGITTIGGLVDINAGGQANTFKVEDLTSGRVVYAGAGGELQDSANLTFDGTTLTANSFGAVSLPDNTSITLGNDDDLELFHAAGGNSYIKNNSPVLELRSDATAINSKNNTVTFLKANASGVMATTGILTATNISGISSVTASTFYGSGANLTNIPTGINTGGTSDFATANVVTLNVSTLLDVDGHTELDDVNVAGVATIASAKVSDLTSGRVVYAGAGGELQDSANLTFNGTTLTANSFAGDGSQLTNLPGIDTAGGSTFNNVFTSGINTLGKGANGKTFLYHADSLKFQTTGIGVSIASGTGKTAYIEGPDEIWIDPHPAGVGTTSGIVRIRGDLYVDGKEVIIDVDKIELGDFQIGIATTAGTNVLLDGAGIGIGSTGIRKTITWNNSTSALMSSENWNIASGKHYEIAGTDVLTATTLGSGVVNSSLTSVGTLGSLVISGTCQAGDFNSTSDIRLKDNIQVIEDPLAKLVQIEGVSFNWKENNKPALGVIADQVQEILPELVTDGDPKTVNYNGLIGLLIEAVKEQQIQIDELKSKLP